MGITENMRALLVKFDISQEGLSRITGYSPSTVSRWISGGSKMRNDTIERVCKKFNLTFEDIVSDTHGLAAQMYGGQDRDTNIKVMRISEGVMTDSGTTFPVPLTITETCDNAYLVEVPDNSMDIVLPKGSYAFVMPCNDITDNQPHLLSIDGTTTIRKLRRLHSGTVVEACSSDPTYPTVTYVDGVDSEIEVVGKIIWDCKPSVWTY